MPKITVEVSSPGTGVATFNRTGMEIETSGLTLRVDGHSEIVNRGAVMKFSISK